MKSRKEILKELKSLFEEAEKYKLWFFHRGISGELWFSPKEIRKEIDSGTPSVWASFAWRLMDPDIRLQVLQAEMIEKEQEYDEFKKRIEEG